MKNEINIIIPAAADNVMPLRLFFSGLATRFGMDINQIDDMKSAVSEACVLLMAGAEGGELSFNVKKEQNELVTECEISGFTPAEYDEDTYSMSRLIFEAMADEAYFGDDDGKIIHIAFKFRRGES